MRKVVVMLFMMIFVFTLTACNPDTPDVLDCSLTPEHEDCQVVLDCAETPEHPDCEVYFTFDDSYQLLDISNDSNDSIADAFTMLTTFIESHDDLFNYSGDENLINYFESHIDTETGLTKEEIVNQVREKDILLKGMNDFHYHLPNEVAMIPGYFNEEEFSEGEYYTYMTDGDYVHDVMLTVNEDSFTYQYKITNSTDPLDTPYIHEMSAKITEQDRLIYEVKKYVLEENGDFDFIYIIYDSLVGYIIKDINYFTDSLEYFEDIVYLEDSTKEVTYVFLGYVYQFEYSYLNGQDGEYFEKTALRSPFGSWEYNDLYAVIEDTTEVVRATRYEGPDQEDTIMNYLYTFNILGLRGWNVVKDDILYDDDQGIAPVLLETYESIGYPYLEVALLLEQEITYDEFHAPKTLLDFEEVEYDTFVASFNEVINMNHLVSYSDNNLTIDTSIYDIRTDLLDLFTSNVISTIEAKMLDGMIVNQITFEGDSVFGEIVDCEMDPTNPVCPTE